MIQLIRKHKFDKIIDTIRIYQRAIPNYEYQEYAYGSGGLITSHDYSSEYYHNPYKYHYVGFPPGVSWDSHIYMFYDNYAPLNGFGMYYVALFIIGNYARYYPDFWMKDIENSSPLSLVIEELLKDAAIALPLLTLSELCQIYYVMEGLPFA